MKSALQSKTAEAVGNDAVTRPVRLLKLIAHGTGQPTRLCVYCNATGQPVNCRAAFEIGFSLPGLPLAATWNQSAGFAEGRVDLTLTIGDAVIPVTGSYPIGMAGYAVHRAGQAAGDDAEPADLPLAGERDLVRSLLARPIPVALDVPTLRRLREVFPGTTSIYGEYWPVGVFRNQRD